MTLDEGQLESIRRELAQTPKLDRVFHVDLVDREGVVYASVDKTIHIRRRDATSSTGP